MIFGKLGNVFQDSSEDNGGIGWGMDISFCFIDAEIGEAMGAVIIGRGDVWVAGFDILTFVLRPFFVAVEIFHVGSEIA